MERFRALGELISYLWRTKRFIVLPLVIVLVVVSVLIIVSEASAVAPFLYPLY